MIELLKQQDIRLFIFINHLPHNYFLNSFFALLSGIGKWGIIWFIIAAILFFWEEKKNFRKFVSLTLALVTSGVAVEFILKNLIKRVRPEFVIPFTISVAEKSASYSFPSGHATIAFAAGFILGRQHKKMKWLYYLLAFLIAFSRIYLGKHYPSDVIVGAAIGLLIGFFSIQLINRFPIKPTKI